MGELTVRVMPVAFSPKQFEEAFGIGHTKLYEEIKAGRLIARKLGTRTIILASDAEAWAQSLPRAGRGNEWGKGIGTRPVGLRLISERGEER